MSWKRERVRLSRAGRGCSLIGERSRGIVNKWSGLVRNICDRRLELRERPSVLFSSPSSWWLCIRISSSALVSARIPLLSSPLLLPCPPSPPCCRRGDSPSIVRRDPDAAHREPCSTVPRSGCDVPWPILLVLVPAPGVSSASGYLYMFRRLQTATPRCARPDTATACGVLVVVVERTITRGNDGDRWVVCCRVVWNCRLVRRRGSERCMSLSNLG